jgi:AraC family transcriptional regulator
VETANCLIDVPHENSAGAIPILINAAVASFDADRDTSRRYLLRASALLRANGGGRTSAESARQPKTRGGLLAWQLNRVVDYIESHLEHKITIKYLADVSQVSTGTFFRAFKISTGVTPLHYVTARRIEFACTMMTTTRAPLAEVALAAGLTDQAHFSKIFRRAFGMPPSAWRRANQAPIE